jgi:hypothetical protein
VYRVDGAALVRGAFGGDAVVVLFASRCHPVCGPLPNPRRQLPAVIYHGMEAEACSHVISADPSRATAKYASTGVGATRSGGLVTTSLHPGHIVGPGWHPIGPSGTSTPGVAHDLRR